MKFIKSGTVIIHELYRTDNFYLQTLLLAEVAFPSANCSETPSLSQNFAVDISEAVTLWHSEANELLSTTDSQN